MADCLMLAPPTNVRMGGVSKYMVDGCVVGGVGCAASCMFDVAVVPICVELL